MEEESEYETYYYDQILFNWSKINSFNQPYYDIIKENIEKAINLDFSFNFNSKKNDLIVFYNNNSFMKIDYVKEKNINLVKLSELYLYHYISFFNTLNLDYKLFNLLGRSDKIVNFNISYIDKIKKFFDNFSNAKDNNENNTNEKSLCEVKKLILREINIIDDINQNIKKEKNIMNESKENKEVIYIKKYTKKIKEDEFQCELCKKKFISFHYIKLHFKNKHSENMKKEIEGKIDEKENDNVQFIKDLPQDLREDILLNLDPDSINNLTPELQNEYYNLIENKNRINEKDLKDPPKFLSSFSDNNDISEKEDSIYIDDEISYFIYKKLEIKKVNDNSNMNDYELPKINLNLLLQILDDDFIENLLLYNMKISHMRKNFSDNIFLNPNPYSILLKKLIINKHFRYKILDFIFILFLCDTITIKDMLEKEKKLEKNNVLKKLLYLYFDLGLDENKVIDYYGTIFIKLYNQNQKDINQYLLYSTFNEKGEYISIKNKKEYSTIKSLIDLKKYLNMKFNINQNVFGNLVNNFFSFKTSFTQTIFRLRLFSNITEEIYNFSKNNKYNCINNQNKKMDIMYINHNIIGNLIDLYNSFKIFLLDGEYRYNNYPTTFLNKCGILKEDFYKIIYDKILEKSESLKNEILEEFNNNVSCKFDKSIPQIVLLTIIKFIEIRFNNILVRYNTKTDSNEINIKYKILRNRLLKQFKIFINNLVGILYPLFQELNALIIEENKKIKNSPEKNLEISLSIDLLDVFISLSRLYILLYSKKNRISRYMDERSFHLETLNFSYNNDSKVFSEVDYINFFEKFCEDNKKNINIYIMKNQNYKKIEYSFIKKLSPILEIENKISIFINELKKLRRQNMDLKINVHRNGNELFKDSYNSLSNITPEQWRSNFEIEFIGEIGVDMGGLKREWLSILIEEILKKDYSLFSLSEEGNYKYTIDPNSGSFDKIEHLNQFEFIGKIIAKALYDNMVYNSNTLLNCHFTGIIYKFITNTPISYRSMQDYDPKLYETLKELLTNDYTGKETERTFADLQENFGEMKIIDLIENGRNIEVTENNKFDYVQKLCKVRLYENIEPQIEALLKGFYSIIPKDLITIFNFREIENIISGYPKINVDDWKKNTIYEGYTEDSPVIKYFWEIIESYTNEQRAEVLQFVTGTSKLPINGFNGMENRFQISREPDAKLLPRASTCFNKLLLPEYSTKEILKKRLECALEKGREFGLA